MHNDMFDETTNKEIFGKCNNLNGHGHNYTVEAVVKGKITRETGMVINLFDLKKIINQVIEPLDHKMLNVDIEQFKGIIPSAENIAVHVWDSMSDQLPDNVVMHSVRIYETDKNSVAYYGEST